MSEAIQADVAILGSGPAGLSLAAALSDASLSVVLLDNVPASATTPPPKPERTLALSLGSTRILATLGIELREADPRPIQSIRVTQAGMAGEILLDAQLLDEEILGQVLDFSALKSVLAKRAAKSTNLVQICFGPARHLQQHLGAVSLHDDQREVRARLLVGADGGHGPLLQLAGLNRIAWEHNKYACIASVTPGRLPTGFAFEHFLPSGPLALLPFTDHRFSLVWSVTPAEAARIESMNDSAFLIHLNRHLPPQVSRIVATGPRAFLPLGFQRTLSNNRGRLVLIGNAAQTLHPVAGQGFNLGLRDAVTLAEMIKAAAKRGEDFGSDAFLRRYRDSRRWDRSQVIGFTEGLARLFSNDLLPLKLARALGLSVLNHMPSLKRQLAARAAGLLLPASSHTPALTPKTPVSRSGDSHGH